MSFPAVRQALFEPVADGVPVNIVKISYFFHRIAAIDFRRPRIVICHSQFLIAAGFNSLIQPLLDFKVNPTNGSSAERDRFGKRAFRNAKINC
ncbi:MAG: hypothetical protein ABS27_05735 [OM182 bacterium BACL3 MAG-121001-bin29]|uniref:Uncharacterized protein n=4 Tax=OM182 clade TaxID=745002 RepID=A0A0R2SEA9_9GAMM|nr:MAG: hypothetical protein ABR69_03865 [OM182 bacterium BACL3 MAG-120507-bin80]KRO83030.1 MAG: hypothetical protein ABR85_05840 [OM182 bacterium BACL3 MAG-120619-bin3]KRO84831.1 MAG: hypothetical protein ABR72_05490 [OM182 bacterium BACL3 MAG-120920-bin41]KRP33493.1 MAG: hypothetical protein ABS27_05735 [OM182 bacterium BACL3 MAG-121001-bin29]KRP36313.1 MAG: hypothetical protein ABS26_10765 [OM182 bacterium BACL3 MAG-120531-bin86]